jgi:dihydrofolate reductase
MSHGKLRVESFTISLDGFGAGPDQSQENPLGVGGMEIHKWFRPTNTFQKMVLGKTGETGVDDDFAKRGFENFGAHIMGRNMFGPVRGEWPDDSWKGWWGDNPPYHTPVFVLTNHARESLEMEGGTTFHFVTGGIHEALERARAAAGDLDIRLSGGVSTVRQYLEERLVDEMHLAISPILLGSGENLFHGLDLRALGYGRIEHVSTPLATHVIIRKE